MGVFFLVLAAAVMAVVWAVALLIADSSGWRRRVQLEAPCSGYGVGRFSKGETRYDLGPVVYEGRVLRGALYGRGLGISVGQMVEVDLDPIAPARMYPRGGMPRFPHWVASLVYGGCGVLLAGLGLAIAAV
ncbi:hypothetical protein ABZY02_03670 [Streptomyces sp. NPDC006649]|uniref:hypothetical protein n=1 Tax=Streptomyces sp. NPDC006649 TaxID=3156896 RepID=UPI0033BB8404